MKAKITHINAEPKTVEYDVYKDDGTTRIASGETADYSVAIPDPSTATFIDFAGVVIADAQAKKGALTTKLQGRKTANQTVIDALNSQNSSLDSQIVDLGTTVQAFA